MRGFDAVRVWGLCWVTLIMPACGEYEDYSIGRHFSSAGYALGNGFACLALEPGSGETFIETDSSEAGARGAAREECESRTGEVCVVQRCWDTTFHAEGTDIFGRWACIAEDPKTSEPFCERGDDLQDARRNSLEACRRETARTCTIRRCFPAD